MSSELISQLPINRVEDYKEDQAFEEESCIICLGVLATAQSVRETLLVSLMCNLRQK